MEEELLLLGCIWPMQPTPQLKTRDALLSNYLSAVMSYYSFEGLLFREGATGAQAAEGHTSARASPPPRFALKSNDLLHLITKDRTPVFVRRRDRHGARHEGPHGLQRGAPP